MHEVAQVASLLMSLILGLGLGDRSPEDLDHVTRPTAAERTRVQHAMMTGTLESASGEPIAGARVTLTDVRKEGLAGKIESLVATTTTDADGRFELAALDVQGSLWLRE